MKYTKEKGKRYETNDLLFYGLQPLHYPKQSYLSCMIGIMADNLPQIIRKFFIRIKKRIAHFFCSFFYFFMKLAGSFYFFVPIGIICSIGRRLPIFGFGIWFFRITE